MPIADVTDSDFEEKVLKAEKPVFVDFWAPWCGPCKMAEPVLQELSEENKDKIIFVKINVDDNPQTAQKFQVMSIPTTVLFKDGEKVGSQIGFTGKQAYQDLLQKV